MALVTAALVAGLNVHSVAAGRAVAAAGARPFVGCAWIHAIHAVTDVLEAQARPQSAASLHHVTLMCAVVTKCKCACGRLGMHDDSNACQYAAQI